MDAKKAGYSTIDEYIQMFPDETKRILQEIREVIKKAAPQATETINYAIPTFVLNGNLVHFAGFKKHIGFYPTPAGIEKFKNELAPYEQAKGSVQFPLDQPMPYELIRRITEFRVQENLQKPVKKSKKQAA